MREKNALVEPKVGLMGTMFVGSDEYPVVIVDVISKKKVNVVIMYENDYDQDVTIDSCGNDIYKYDTNDLKVDLGNRMLTYTLRKNNRWVREHDGLWSCGAVVFGKANKYIDPNF